MNVVSCSVKESIVSDLSAKKKKKTNRVTPRRRVKLRSFLRDTAPPSLRR